MNHAAGEHPRLVHQPALDGLRGLAVAGVLLFHGGHLTGGFLGVDAFFVLSGFLITSLLLGEAREHGRVALGAFWARRARRLLPALACVLAAVALYAAVLAKPEELATIRGDALATVFYVANWRAIATSHDYWSMFRAPSPLDHTWSLAIEEQFYLLWPLLVAFFVYMSRARLTARRLFFLSATLALASLIWTQIIFDEAKPSRAYYGTDARVASILIGAALAAWLSWRGAASSKPARIGIEVAAIIAFFVVMVAWARMSGSSTTLYRGGLFVIAIATAIVIAAAVHPRRGPLSRLLSFGPLCSLGLISYGVYLWHWPIYMVLDQQRLQFGGWPLLAVRIAVTFAIAIVSYRLVEQPIRRGTGAWAAPRLRTSVFATTGVAVLVVSAIIGATARAPAPNSLRADPIRTYVPPPVQSNPSRAGRRPARQLPVPIPRILVVGNSIALYDGDEGFKRLLTTPPLDVLNIGTIGCRLLPEETRTRDQNGDVRSIPAQVCREQWAKAVSAFRPDVVVILFADPGSFDYEINGHWTSPCAPLYDQVFDGEMHDQIRLLASRGAHVVVTTSAYNAFPFHPAAMFTHTDCQNTILRKVATSEPSAVLADLFAWMCPHVEDECMNHAGGLMELRPDGLHFRHASARLLAAWLIKQAQRHGVLAQVRTNGPESDAIYIPLSS